ncbi:alpha/beta fold hydrolase [Leptospira interrogans]
MARVKTADGYELHYEKAGAGVPIIFVHEFAGDHRSWEYQLRHFGKTHLCVSFAARGFSPSDIPTDPAAYTQAHSADDILAVLNAIGAETAHIVGLSMGALATLHFGLRHPKRARSLCLGGCGYGSDLDKLKAFRARSALTGQAIDKMGMPDFARVYATGVGRVQFLNKDPRGYAEFLSLLEGHDAAGSAATQRYIQGNRPSIYTLEDSLRALVAPTLIMLGDEDYSCFEPAMFLKKTVSSAAISIIPNSGHSINLEEPDEYNRILGSFLHQVEAGRWPMRDRRAEEIPNFPV